MPVLHHQAEDAPAHVHGLSDDAVGIRHPRRGPHDAAPGRIGQDDPGRIVRNQPPTFPQQLVEHLVDVQRPADRFGDLAQHAGRPGDLDDLLLFRHLPENVDDLDGEPGQQILVRLGERPALRAVRGEHAPACIPGRRAARRGTTPPVRPRRSTRAARRPP